MNVLCLAGAWCGDCIQQCPIFEQFARAAPVLQVRYLDRDEHADAQQELRVNGGDRVPVVVFFSEDGFEVARYGERTLARYRQLVAQLVGESCATGLVKSEKLRRVRPIATQLAVEAKQVELTQADTVRLVEEAWAMLGTRNGVEHD